MKVSDLMTSNVACVRSGESLSTAARVMWDCDCGATPVVDDDTGERVVGMITDRDICMATWSKDRSPSAIRVADAMTRDVWSCGPNDSLMSAESLMRSKQIRRIPVVDENQKLLGILCLADIAKRGKGGISAIGGELPSSEIASTLAGIVEPRSNGHARATA
jgi:CBS domain-containing protein